MVQTNLTIGKTGEEGFVAIILIVVLVMGLIIAMTIMSAATSGGFLNSGGGDTGGVGTSSLPVSGDGGPVPILPNTGNCIIWSWKVEAAFISVVRTGSGRLGVDPNWVMAIMAVETINTFSPSIQNPYSSATGLIQFMPNTATELGTSIGSLRGMSRVEQWRYVEEYLRRKIRAHGRPRDLGSAYMLVFTPIYTQSPDEKVMYQHDGGACRVNGQMRKTAYCQNQVYDYAPKDGKITKFEAAEAARRKFREGYAGCARANNR